MTRTFVVTGRLGQVLEFINKGILIAPITEVKFRHTKFHHELVAARITFDIPDGEEEKERYDITFTSLIETDEGFFAFDISKDRK